MSALDDIMRDSNEFLFAGIRRITAPLNELLKDKLDNFIKFNETNDVSWLIKEQNKCNEQTEKENKNPNTTKSGKENATTATNFDPKITIKQEKLSIISNKTTSNKPSTSSRQQSLLSANSTASEESNFMPAPSKVPPRKKKIKTEPVDQPHQRQTRSTRSKSKIQTDDKPSDSIIQNPTITMIEDKNADEKPSDNEESHNLPVKSKRSKKRQSKKKKEKAEAEETKIAKSNQKESITIQKGNVNTSKSSNESEKNDTAQTEYEDASSTVDIAETNNVNATMVLDEPKIVFNKESKISNYKTPPRTKSKKQQIQEIFSPYEKSTLKKKVEAFEKFGSASKEPSSTTKIPQLYKDHGTGSATKTFTPLQKFYPKSCSTMAKMSNKLFLDNKNSLQNNESVLSTKSLSTLKASQAEYREREKLRQEKEKEAQMKKEAILKAQAEERRRKREEKQLKVQQQRDLLIQKEKEKLLEFQKQKEERHEQAKAEKEEKLQKSKAEDEKKRLLTKNKAKLVKDSDDRVLAEKRQKGALPKYMTTNAPLLPSADCYDSDDEQAECHKEIPAWCSGNAFNKQLYTQYFVGETIKNSLFCSMNENPDLVQIFERVDYTKLKRTSSALWKKPPRYTLFSETNDIIFSEDSD